MLAIVLSVPRITVSVIFLYRVRLLYILVYTKRRVYWYILGIHNKKTGYWYILVYTKHIVYWYSLVYTKQTVYWKSICLQKTNSLLVDHFLVKDEVSPVLTNADCIKRWDNFSRWYFIIMWILKADHESVFSSTASSLYKVVCSLPAHVDVYSIQHYVFKLVSDLQRVGGLHRVLRFPPSIKLTTTI